MQSYPDSLSSNPQSVVAGIFRYLDINDLSILLKRSVNTIRNQLCAQEKDPSLNLVPKPFRPRGSRLLRWHPMDVADFMAADSGRTVVLGGIKQPAMTFPPRRLGRPTKVEQLARRQAVEAVGNDPQEQLSIENLPARTRGISHSFAR
jgi:hypothetical protein